MTTEQFVTEGAVVEYIFFSFITRMCYHRERHLEGQHILSMKATVGFNEIRIRDLWVASEFSHHYAIASFRGCGSILTLRKIPI